MGKHEDAKDADVTVATAATQQGITLTPTETKLDANKNEENGDKFGEHRCRRQPDRQQAWALLGGDLNGEMQGGFGFGKGNFGVGQGYGTIGHGSGVPVAAAVVCGATRSLGATSLLLLNSAGDATFDDLTAFIPGLSIETADALRRSLGTPRRPTRSAMPRAHCSARAASGCRPAFIAGAIASWRSTTRGTSDGAARRRKVSSRPRRTTVRPGPAAMPATGLDVVRPVASDDIALGLAYLPVWIADPAHNAQYFDVSAEWSRS